jgi:hypothetical protein
MGHMKGTSDKLEKGFSWSWGIASARPSKYKHCYLKKKKKGEKKREVYSVQRV